MRGATRATAYRRIARFAASVVFVWGCAPTTQGAIAPVRTPLETLRHSIDSLVSNPQFRSSDIGLLVVNPVTSDTLYSLNAGKLFVPASNMKIITGASALALLGPDYRFKTDFVALGLVRDSVIDGHLAVIGRGDPTISNRVQQGNAMTWMARVADSLVAHGIKRVSGRLVRGPNFFPDTIYGYGWEWDDLSGESAAPIDELLYNEGMTTVTRRIAGRDTIVATATTSPARTYLEALASALDSGAAVVSRQLLAWGAERDGFIVYDGSGMSRHDLLTPETIVRTLVAIQRDTAFQVFYDALPIAGVDGTIRTRMVGTPAAGNLRAKTGSLEFVRSLSGYVTDGDGDRLVFSILNNDFTVPVDSVSRFQNNIGALLAGYRARRR